MRSARVVTDCDALAAAIGELRIADPRDGPSPLEWCLSIVADTDSIGCTELRRTVLTTLADTMRPTGRDPVAAVTHHEDATADNTVPWVNATADEVEVVLSIARAARVAEGDAASPEALTRFCGAAANALPLARLITATGENLGLQDPSSVWVAHAVMSRLPRGLPTKMVDDPAVVEAAGLAIAAFGRTVDAEAVVVDDGVDTAAKATERVDAACAAVLPPTAALAEWATGEHAGGALARAFARGSLTPELLRLIALCAPGDLREHTPFLHPTSPAEARSAAERTLTTVVQAARPSYRGNGLPTASWLYGQHLAAVLRRLDAVNFAARGKSAAGVCWAITTVVYPDLDAVVVGASLPAVLGLIERHEKQYRHLGLAAAAHVLRHALPTDLRLSGTGAVLVETIRPLLHDREPDTIDALRPTLLAVLPITEPKPSVKGSKLHDFILSKMLSDMDGETTFARRRALCKTAVGVAARLEIGVVKHLNTLLTVSLAYLVEVHDEPSQLEAARLLRCAIQHGWPRFPPPRAAELVGVIRECRPSADDNGSKTRAALRNTVNECLSMLETLMGQEMPAK